MYLFDIGHADMTIKLWKVYEKSFRGELDMDSQPDHNVRVPRLEVKEKAVVAKQKATFTHSNAMHINSISPCRYLYCDWEVHKANV